jgi:hypothetical protein
MRRPLSTSWGHWFEPSTAHFAGRNPACYAGHADFDRLLVSIPVLAADAA